MNAIKVIQKMKDKLPTNYYINEKLSLESKNVWASYCGLDLKPPAKWTGKKWEIISLR